MWFKNAQIFQLANPLEQSPEQLEEIIKRFAFIPCGTHQIRSAGWVAPNGTEDGPLVYPANESVLVCLRLEEKVIPPSMHKELTADRISEAETNLGKKLNKKQREEIKEDVYQQLISKALTKSTQTFGYLDLRKNWLIVDAASSKKAEDFVTMLRRSIGSLKVQRPQVQNIAMLLTHWLRDDACPEELVIEDSCQIKDQEEGGSINCKRQDLKTEEILSLLGDGREVVQLSLCWRELVSFQLNLEFTLKSLRFLDIVQDQANDIVSETPEERFDADLVIMIDTLREFFDYLLQILSQQGPNQAPEASPLEHHQGED